MRIDEHPDWPELKALCLSKASEFALFWAGEPPEAMFASLRQTRQELLAHFAKVFDDFVTHAMVDAFVTAVVDRKSEIDKGAFLDRRLN